MIRSDLCDYSYTSIVVKATITVPITGDAGAAINNTNKKVILKIVLHLLVLLPK